MADYENDIKQAVTTLNAGGVILYPTDTIWGLGCDPYNVAALDKIYSIKQRPREKSFIVLLADARDILQYVAAPPPDIIDIVNSFDIPTTVIYGGILGLPDELLHNSGTLAIRVTTDPFCKALIKRWGKPLVSTSANISGDPSAATYTEVSEAIREGVDYTVRHRQIDTTPAQASRIVKISDEGEVTILRK